MADTPKTIYDYYVRWARDTLTDLIQTYEELSTKISVSQKSYSWYLYLDWRNISEEEFVCLSILIGIVERYSFKYVFRWEKPELLWLWEEMVEQYLLCAKRFKNSSKGKYWSVQAERSFRTFPDFPDNPGFLPITEFEGNYVKFFKKWIEKHYTLRYSTPKRLKKTERIRGYRDHGSASSVSERARRQANTSPIRGVDQDGKVVDWQLYSQSLQFIKQQKRNLEGD